ncbi:hypothetical protein RND71_009250 [Anisodus tanguticus]|uniref:F-box domain-containing protein n=1 Tax=Anisodus tanguticus TaxID=243964 RepID=A0AAE1VRM9_9SOLA|nr:hypothetical protein RND71_009250 [Anisodus tanguticus]
MEGVLAVRMQIVEIAYFVLLFSFYRLLVIIVCYVMPPKGRKRSRSLPPDVLSNLPDNVIDVILMCFPCKDAVRTSILSKKWSSICLKNVPRLVKVSLAGDDMRAEDLDFAKVFESCSALEHPLLDFFNGRVYSEAEDDDRILESLELEHFSDVTFNHLREVKLVCFGGTTPELQLIKLLLAKSPVLVKMLIDTCDLDDEPLETRLKIFAEVDASL